MGVAHRHTATGATSTTTRDEHGHLAHVAVVERPVAGGTVPSLVFGELTAGRYDLFVKGPTPGYVELTVERRRRARSTATVAALARV